MTNQALKPEAFNAFKAIAEEKLNAQAEKAGVDADELSIAHMRNTRGWELLKEYLEARIVQLDAVRNRQISEGASFDEVGRITVVSELAKEHIRGIISFVEDAGTYVEEHAGK